MAARRRDGVGRREEFWREHVVRWEQSGQSIRGYCRAQGLSEPGFHYWKREVKRRDGERAERTGARGRGEDASRPEGGRPRTSRVAFAEVRLATSPAREALIEIACDGQRRIEVHPGFDEETLARVIAVVERGSC